MEERRQASRQKWTQESLKRSQWRTQHSRELQSTAEAELASRQRLWQERKSRPLPRPGAKGSRPSNADIISCWISVQLSPTRPWKRRFCRLKATGLFLYDSSVSSNEITRIGFNKDLSIVEGIDSWEELQVLPNTFALKFGQDAVYTILADNAEQKEQLISAIVQLAGL